ncbi:MAG: GNAT family N-acetyltransferase [Reyranella sp.]|nr:GNAT family N-acetyltransferase [Reyranella sp.]
MSTIEHLTAADHAAVGCLLREAYADYAERIGLDAWKRLGDGLAQAAGQLRDAEIAGVRGTAGLDAVVFYFPPGKSDEKIFPREWASLRLLGVARSARGRGLSRQLTEWCIARARQQGAAEIGLHTSEAMTTARGLYERMGFVVDGDLPMNFGLRYWRFRRSLEGG